MIGRMLLRWELQQSLRSYWFLANAGVFVAGGLLLMVFGQTDVSVLGYRGFARALAALRICLGLLLVLKLVDRAQHLQAWHDDDGIHPLANGYAIVTQTVFQHLEPMLKKH